MRAFLISIVMLMVPAMVMASPGFIKIGHFSETGLSGWSGKSFKGETDYRIVTVDDREVLQAVSENAASGLILESEFDPNEYPILTWQWKIDKTIDKGDSRSKRTDDYAARIYVVFPHWFFPRTKTINYIWANRLPKGESQLSVYTSNDMMIAVESGSENAGQWMTVRRNIVEDYRKAFGEDPPEVGAIAIMTDTDNTGESATAWYGDITAGLE